MFNNLHLYLMLVAQLLNEIMAQVPTLQALNIPTNHKLLKVLMFTAHVCKDKDTSV